jgi:cellulose synthase/poly-beta-1,6-N-acetylglucosamine synthase-like glycosyltransferase
LDISNEKSKVIVLYCTCNDFNSAALKKCINQDYENIEYIILDDSKAEEYKNQADKFAEENNIKIIRRDNNIGFKAGNINNYLKNVREEPYDYFVILDSDEIIPNDFVSHCLKYYNAIPNKLGILQANHISTQNKNAFMNIFHKGVNSCWSSIQWVKSRYGFQCLLGHGAMVKRECYEDTDGFPHVVAEDIAFTLETKKYGWKTIIAPDIICEEEFPVDYSAFRKRQSKWSQGNLEFTKKYMGVLFSKKSGLKWNERLDLWLSPFTLVFSTFTIFLLMGLTVGVSFFGGTIGEYFHWWMGIPSLIFFLAPMLPDLTTWYKLNVFKYICYIVGSFALYGSTIFISMVSLILGLFGKKAKFIVTPKNSQKIGLGFAVKNYILDIIFIGILAAFSIYFNSLFLFGLIISAEIIAFFLYFLSNKQYSETQTAKNDLITSNISKNKFRCVYESKKKIYGQAVK